MIPLDRHNTGIWIGVLTCVLLADSSPRAVGQSPTNIWTATASGNWTGTNWDLAPSALGNIDAILSFNNSGSLFLHAYNDLPGAFQLNGLILSSTSTRPTIIDGEALNFTQSSSSAFPFINQNGTGAVVIQNALTISQMTTVGGSGTGPLVLNGAMANSGGLVFDNSYAVYQGALSVVSGNGGLTKSNAGTLYLYGANAFAGNVAVTGGAIAIVGPGAGNDPTALGSGAKTVTLNGGTLKLLSGTLDFAAGTKTFAIGASGGTINVCLDASVVLDGIDQLTGSGVLTKLGLGTLRLDSDFGGNFLGNLTVTQGTLNLRNASAIAGGSALITVNSGGTLDFASSSPVNYAKNIDASGYGFNGQGAIVNSNGSAVVLSGTITLSGGTGLGAANSGSQITFNGPVNGSGGLIKSGAGTVTLTGANNFTGTTTVRGGTLALDYTTNNSSKVDTNQSLNLNGGSLTITSNSSGDSGGNPTQLVNGLAIGIGASELTITSAAGVTTTLDTRGASGTTNINRVPGGVVNFTLNNNGGTAVIKVGPASSFLGYATVSGSTWATTDSSKQIVGLATYSSTIVSGTDVSLSATNAWGSGVTVNSLRFDSSAGGGVIMSSAGIRTIATGGILVTSARGSNPTTISGMTSAILTTTNADGLTVINNSSGLLSIAVPIGASGATYGVTKAGNGTVRLSGSNQFIGGVFVTQGTLVAGGIRALGTTASVATLANGATLALQVDAATSFDNPITVDANALSATINFQHSTTAGSNVTHQVGALQVGSAMATQTLNFTQAGTYNLRVNGTTTLMGPSILNVAGGTVTLNQNVTDGASSFGLTKTGAGTLTLAAANTFDGGYVQSAGATQIKSSSTLSSQAILNGPLGTGLLTLAGGSLQDDGIPRTIHNSVAITGNITFSSSGSGALLLTDAGLANASTIDIRAINPTLTVLTTTSFSQVITGGSFTKAGAGTLTLSRDNLFAGLTVNDGTLIVANSSGSATGTGPVQVNASSKLTGNGFIGGSINVMAFGKIAPGSSIGTLSIHESVALFSNSILEIDLGLTGSSDLIAIAGTTSTFDLKTGANVTLHRDVTFVDGSAEYVIASLPTGHGNQFLLDGAPTTDGQILGRYTQGTGTDAGLPVVLQTDSSFASLGTGEMFTLMRVGDNLVVNYTPAPEPAAALLIGAIALLLVSRRVNVSLQQIIPDVSPTR